MNKKNKLIKLIIIFLLITYISLYTGSKTGLISVKNKYNEEVNLKIEEFDALIESGENLNLDRYISEKKDYSNFFSNLGLGVSNLIMYIINDGFKSIFNFIYKFFS